MSSLRCGTSKLLVLTLCGCAMGGVSAGCGGAEKRMRGEQALVALRSEIERPIDSQTAATRNSRLVEDVVAGEVLEGLRRDEVLNLLGPGEPCGRRPRCVDNGFESGDWIYTVGRMGAKHAAQPPLLIIGFDRFGHVARTWNLRVH